MKNQDEFIATTAAEKTGKGYSNIKFLIAGIIFGIVLTKAQVISWFRIQEMFRFQSFHMYGVIGSAVGVGMLSVFLIKKFNIKTISGEKIEIPSKKFNKGQIFGGLIFGAGWALTGACPGPLYAQIGTGATVVIITLLSAIAGTWVYGRISQKLPH
ncbi:transporter [Niabella ginsenosidivorans]|uniref:Transporter n=1 Tax=Niabella ginsenosidivorans TaxID=1176587 RepID=A0A1A9I8Q3_9BACT|nr:transporter [Niabella ginsenosidivorans]